MNEFENLMLDFISKLENEYLDIQKNAFVDVHRAAEYLNVSERSIREMCSHNILKNIRYGQRGGGEIRIFSSSLLEYVEKLSHPKFKQDEYFTNHFA